MLLLLPTTPLDPRLVSGSDAKVKRLQKTDDLWYMPICTGEGHSEDPWHLCTQPLFLWACFPRDAVGGDVALLFKNTSLVCAPHPCCPPPAWTAGVERGRGRAVPREEGGGGGGGGQHTEEICCRTSLGKRQGLLAEAPAPTFAVTTAVQLLASLLEGAC